jgi:small subunit ribosomal protein S17
MADDEKNETTEEQVPEQQVPGTDPEPAAEAAPEPVEEAPEEGPGTDPEPAAEAAPEPAAEAAPEPAAEAEPEAPAKPTRSRKHVPRSQRRTRPRPKREPSAPRKAITRTPKPEGERGRRQERRGVVISDAGDKTIVVKVDVIKSHPRYKKVVRRTVRFHAHDEQNTAGVGDTVRIVETRPLSKTKHWRLAEIVEKAK